MFSRLTSPTCFRPSAGQSESTTRAAGAKIRNLTGQQIRAFRRNRKWSQSKLAGVIRTMGAPMTREIIANLETRRTRVKDYDLVLVAKALQIPMDSLFPDEAGVTNSPDDFNNNPQSQNPLEARRRNGQLNPSPVWRENLESLQSGSLRAGEKSFHLDNDKKCRFITAIAFSPV